MAYNQPYYGYYPQYNNGASPDMLNQFKGQYQQPMQIPVQQMQQPAPMQTTNNDMIWVLGEVEATSYPVAPNNTVTLWDKNQPTIYIKSANAQGVPSMRVLDFTERTANAQNAPTEHICKCGDKFVPKSDFKELEGKYQELLCRLSDIEDKYIKLTAKNTPKTAKKTEVE